MKVIVDNKIPFIKDAISQIADEVVFLPGSEFTPAAVHDADALIIRTRTCCNSALLQGSRVKFIATATIGFDHIDTDYCRRAGITWTNAPGCNSASVAQYIESSLLLLQSTCGMKLQEMTIGIIGVGNVGSKVATVARELGMRVLLNDPPRQDREEKHCSSDTSITSTEPDASAPAALIPSTQPDAPFTSLATIAAQCHIITFHTPLYKEGRYKTLHLADDAFFARLKLRPVIINTSRGEVVDTHALLQALSSGTVSHAIIDVWENEPTPHPTLLDKAIIATPHIAGYSADGKANATRMSLDALCRYFGIEAAYEIVPPPPTCAQIVATTPAEALLNIYNPTKDSDALKSNPALFEKLRGDYPLRREKGAYSIAIAEAE